MVHPGLIVKIPADGLFDAFLKLKRRLPTELTLKLARIDGIAHVVTKSVSDIGYEVLTVTFGITEQTIDSAYDHTYKVNVFPLIESSDVISVGNLSLMEYQIDGAGMVLNEEPVTHIFTLAVDWQRLAVAYIVYKQRYQLFGELVRAVVVGTIGYNCRHSVGVVIGTHKVVARRL